MTDPRPAACRAGDDALARGDWDEARAAFEQALAERESPEALEGLGLAGWWLDLADVVFDSRERAYRLFRDRDDRVGAARVAIWLGWDTWAFRGEEAVASGWLQRARRLLEDEGDVAERAWLELREGALALVAGTWPPGQGRSTSREDISRTRSICFCDAAHPTRWRGRASSSRGCSRPSGALRRLWLRRGARWI
jgi:hypothetical protein